MCTVLLETVLMSRGISLRRRGWFAIHGFGGTLAPISAGCLDFSMPYRTGDRDPRVSQRYQNFIGEEGIHQPREVLGNHENLRKRIDLVK